MDTLYGLLTALILTTGAVTQGVAHEDGLHLPPGPGLTFPQRSGEALYRSVCRACHMENGAGATGAGSYPSLRNNAKLAAAGYPIALVIAGRKAMPPLGNYMSNKQVAEVVNYVRTHFDNKFADAVSPQEVESTRNTLAGH